MKSIPQFTKPWNSVAMDFIVKLPKSKDPATRKEYDSIFTIMDQLTKEIKFILVNKAINAPETVHLVLKEMVATKGLPQEWITNRDPRFMSHFWQTIMGNLGIEHKASTAFHPQMNGQNEQFNQTLEQYLQNYIDYEQRNWIELLPTVQFAYNSLVNATTGMTPFFMAKGREPMIQRKPVEIENQSHDAKLSAKHMKDLHKIL